MTCDCDFDIYSFKDNKISERLELHSVMTVLIGERILSKMQKGTTRILSKEGITPDIFSNIVLLGLALHDLGKALPKYQKSNKEKLSFFNHEIYSFYFATKILYLLNSSILEKKRSLAKKINSIILGTSLAILRHHQAMRDEIKIILNLCKIKAQLKDNEVTKYIFCAINKISKALLDAKSKVANDIGIKLNKIDYMTIRDLINEFEECDDESKWLSRCVRLCYNEETDLQALKVSYHSYYMASQILLISDNISAFLTRNGYNLDDFCQLTNFKRRFIRKIALNIRKIICGGV